MKEKDIQILKYRTLQGQYLQANNKIVSLEKALDAANGESHELRELRKADLCHISYLESEISAKDKTIREKDEEIAKLKAELAEARRQNEQMGREKEDIVKETEAIKECLSLSKEASVDLKNIVGLLQLRMFSKNNDRTRFLNGEFDFDERRVEELGFKGMMGELNTLVKSLSKEAACNGEAEEVDKPKLPKDKKKSAKKRRPGYKRNVFSGTLSRSLDNIAERTIRKLTIQRNNALHFGSDAGVEMAAAYHSVISTVKLHGMSCWRYLGDFFQKIFKGCRDFLSLTPSNIAVD